jgi:Protein of unknown function (DUF1059)
MLEYCCECGALFTGKTDREVMLAAVAHVCEEHDAAGRPAQTAVQVLDRIVEAA